MAQTSFPDQQSRPSLQRLLSIVVPVIVVIAVAIVLLVHFTASSGGASPQATPGGNLATPGGAQPQPNTGVSP